MLIYLLYCEESQKYYVGQTGRTLEQRWYFHTRESLNLKHKASRSHLHAAIRKYGPEKFEKFILVDGLTKEQANIYERLWIRSLNSDDSDVGYNLGTGGEGVSLTPQTIQKMRIAKLGRKLSLETKQKLSESHKKISHPDRFTSGHTPWNKNLEYSPAGESINTRFPKGHVPWNKGKKNASQSS